MGVNNNQFFGDLNNPTPGDDVYYYWLTAAELQTLSQLWPEFARFFVMTYPATPGIFYAPYGDLGATEIAILNSMGMNRLEGFEISNQPGIFGG